MQPPREAVEQALKLARAVKEEAGTGEYTPVFLVMQLAAAVEHLAAALLERLSAEQTDHAKAEQPAACER